MKSTILNISLLVTLAVTAAPLCADAPTRLEGFRDITFLTAADGVLDSPDDLVYDADPCDPAAPTVLGEVLKPNGEPLTFGEYSQATGRASLKCGKKGTHIEIKASGLVPKGVYTVWLLIGPFDANGMPTSEGSLGASDGSQNSFRASANGQASLSVFQPAGDLSEFGSATDCLLNEEVLVALVYHPNGQTYGPFPGPADAPNPFCFFIEHLMFYSAPE